MKSRRIFIEDTPQDGVTPATFRVHTEGFPDHREVLKSLLKVYEGVKNQIDNPKQGQPVTVTVDVEKLLSAPIDDLRIRS